MWDIFRPDETDVTYFQAGGPCGPELGAAAYTVRRIVKLGKFTVKAVEKLGTKGAGKAVVKSLDDVFTNPSALKAKNLADIEKMAQKEGWEIGTLGKGSQKGNGLMIREVNEKGKYTGRIIQWHPGGGHHGPDPYWKVSSPQGGTVRVGPQFE